LIFDVMGSLSGLFWVFMFSEVICCPFWFGKVGVFGEIRVGV
jgi:hypothetical protein